MLRFSLILVGVRFLSLELFFPLLVLCPALLYYTPGLRYLWFFFFFCESFMIRWLIFPVLSHGYHYFK